MSLEQGREPEPERVPERVRKPERELLLLWRWEKVARVGSRSRGQQFHPLAIRSLAGRPSQRRDESILAARGAGEMILVADDELIVRQAAKNILERRGYRVVLADNGREAVDLFRVLGDKVSLVLLDMTMPVMSGEDAFRELKQIRPEAHVVLTSGYNEAEAVRRFNGKGLAGFVQKPFSSSRLIEKIRGVLDGNGEAPA